MTTPQKAKDTGKDYYFGIPVHYSPTTAFSVSMIHLKMMYPDAEYHWLQGDSHPDRARNRIASQFVESGRKYLIFLDADLKFHPDGIKRLIEHDKPIMAGFYAKKIMGPPQWCANALTEERTKEGFYLLRETGTGCLLIHKDVFTAMREAYPQLKYTCDPDGKKEEYDYFSSGVYYDSIKRRRRWLSEDWAFCWMATDCGFEILGDPDVVLLHEGTVFFPTLPEAKNE